MRRTYTVDCGKDYSQYIDEVELLEDGDCKEIRSRIKLSELVDSRIVGIKKVGLYLVFTVDVAK